MLPEKCSLSFTREIAIATASRSKVAAGTFSVWVVCGTSNSGDRNGSLPLPVLVNNDLLHRTAHVGQFNLLCHVVSSVAIHHDLLSDSRPGDLGWGQDGEVHNQCGGLMNSTAQWNGVHGIARLWFTLSVQTRVVQYLDEPGCKLKLLVYSDFSVFTHVLVLVCDESDCKLQNLMRDDTISWSLHVFVQDLDASDCKVQNLMRIGLTPDESRVCRGPECIGPEVAPFGCFAV